MPVKGAPCEFTSALQRKMDCLGRVRLFIPGMLARKLAYVQVQGEEGQGNPKLFISSVVVGSAHFKYLFFAYLCVISVFLISVLGLFIITLAGILIWLFFQIIF
jgi:hypothetical protein